MGSRSLALSWKLSKWGLVGAALAPGYPVRALDGARFTEEVRTEAITRLEGSAHRRSLAREVHFGISLRGDTVVASADSVMLTELSDGHSRTLDTDGFVGGRYRLLLDSTGMATILERPFIPDDLAEVSDVARAMDDFFPPLPPAMAPGSTSSSGDGKEWRRLSDSSGNQRFRWNDQHSTEGPQSVADSVPALVTEASHEESALVWSSTRGPLAWTRRIASEVTTRLRGRTIRASVMQRIAVRRAR